MTPIRPHRRRTLRAAVAVLAVTGLVAACGDDEPTAADDDASESASEAPSLEVSGAWARTSPRMADAGAIYLEITNDGEVDDALVGAAVDTTVAGTTEIHETAAVEPGAADDDGMDDDDADDDADDDGMDDAADDDADDDGAMDDDAGMMEMRPVDRIEIPAGGTVALEPGGYHIMLLELVAPLEAGTTIEVTLVFEEAGEQVVTADVRDAAA